MPIETVGRKQTNKPDFTLTKCVVRKKYDYLLNEHSRSTYHKQGTSLDIQSIAMNKPDINT